ncbi:MAG TPA: hypothetical protein VHG91_01115 [Longimicrobium sp.]|nr:hypothetical protein [Longimicrobium sp.]
MTQASSGQGLEGEAPRPVVRRVIRRPVAPPATPPDADEGGTGRLLRPAASCPRCGARPAMRVTGALVQALRQQPPETRVGTYQCQRRGCGAIYDLVAGTFLRAS